jgi:LmbE family N-acetylglucosaminyl deacetylase
MADIKFSELHPKTVLAVAAHPDDIDFGASGTVATFAAEGAAVYYLILTDGGSGTEDRSITSERLRDMRRDEQRAAGKILGLKDVFFCDYKDGCLVNDLNVKRDVVRAIRRVKPEVVITMDPGVLYIPERGFINHPDHRAAGQAALDAVFPLARDHMSFPELLADEALEPHKTATVLMITFGSPGNYTVDITDSFEVKMQALAAHASQLTDPDIARQKVTEWAVAAGKAIDVTYAEPFTRIDIA